MIIGRYEVLLEQRTDVKRSSAFIVPIASILGALVIAGLAAWFRRADRDTRFAIAADVVRDGRYLGQITEALFEVGGQYRRSM